MSKQIQPTKQKEEKFLDYWVLNYLYHHPMTPFNAKTLHFAVGKSTGYKKNYFESIVGKLRNFGFLTEPDVGIYVFTTRNFIKIQNSETFQIKIWEISAKTLRRKLPKIRDISENFEKFQKIPKISFFKNFEKYQKILRNFIKIKKSEIFQKTLRNFRKIQKSEKFQKNPIHFRKIREISGKSEKFLKIPKIPRHFRKIWEIVEISGKSEKYPRNFEKS